MYIGGIGTISYRKANTFLTGAVELKFQLLSQERLKNSLESFCSSSCTQLAFTLYLLKLKDFVIIKSSGMYIVGNYPKIREEIIQSHKVKIISVPTFSAANVQSQNTEYTKQLVYWVSSRPYQNICFYSRKCD